MTKKPFVILLVVLVVVLSGIILDLVLLKQISPYGAQQNLLFVFSKSSPTMPIFIKEPLLPKKLTLRQIFDNNFDKISQLPREKVITIIATGDIIPARSVNFQATQRKDFTWPYLKTAEILKQADITFINLETPLIDVCPATQEGMVFCGNSKNIEGLVYAGVDIVSLANNHSSNYGKDALDSTIELLDDNGILVTGISGPKILEIKGMRFAFLGYNDIEKPQKEVSNVEEEKIKSEITAAKKESDFVIVTFHWGTEYLAQPDDRQKYLGHFAIDAGANLVIGNHPHWIQPVEIYKGKLITYAHGNFIFDQEWSLETKQGVVGKYVFYENELIDVEYIPILLENYGQPHFLTGTEKDKVLENMKVQSEILATDNN